MQSNKSFKEHFWLLQKKLKSGENFAFTRFSDGEMDILQGKQLKLDSSQATVDGKRAGPGFSEVDHKEYDPEKHGWFKSLLTKAYVCDKKNYFVGLSCPCCVGKENNQWMKDLRGKDDEFLTWANLLVNSNYPLFLQHMLPLFKEKDVYMVCNKKADLTELPFEVKKSWRIGQNAMINDGHLLDEIDEFIEENNIENALFLSSASSLSNILIHHLFVRHPNNTYIDIGTTLAPHMKLPIQRNYLKGYWLKSGNTEIYKECVW